MDRWSARRAARPSRADRRGLRTRARRCRSRCAEGGAQAARADLLCPQHPEEAGAGARRADRLLHERAGTDARSWLSVARYRAGPLRHGVGEVADQHRCDHATLPPLLADLRVWLLGRFLRTPVRRPLAEMKLKAQIARPRVYETLEPGRS